MTEQEFKKDMFAALWKGILQGGETLSIVEQILKEKAVGSPEYAYYSFVLETKGTGSAVNQTIVAGLLARYKYLFTE